MKLIAAFVLLCMAGTVHMVVLDGACDDQNVCDANLVCDNAKCKKKEGQACSANECLSNANCDTTCKCNADYTVNEDKTKCLKHVGQTCTNNDECLTNGKCDTTCKCKTGYMTVNSDNSKCVAYIDGTCATEADCIAHTTCTSDKKCACAANYVPKTDKTMCLATVGTACSADADCVDNAKCSTNCQCKDNYLAAYDKTCKKAPGQTCAADECGLQAECTGDPKKCACKTGFSSKEGQRCGKKVDEACTNSNQCVANAECDTKCKCMTNYSADGDKFCSGATAVMASLMLMLVAVLTSFWM